MYSRCSLLALLSVSSVSFCLSNSTGPKGWMAICQGRGERADFFLTRVSHFTQRAHCTKANQRKDKACSLSMSASVSVSVFIPPKLCYVMYIWPPRHANMQLPHFDGGNTRLEFFSFCLSPKDGQERSRHDGWTVVWDVSSQCLVFIDKHPSERVSKRTMAKEGGDGEERRGSYALSYLLYLFVLLNIRRPLSTSTVSP